MSSSRSTLSLYAVVLMTILTHTAFNGSRVTVSLYAIHLNASPLTIGTLMSLYALLPMLLAVTAGRFIDRVGVRLPMLAAAALVSAGCSLPFALESLAALYFATALIGTGFMVFHVAVNSAVGSIGEPAERIRNFSLLALGFSISGFLGPMVAGFAIDHTSYTRTFLILALLPLVTVAVLALKRIPLPNPQGSQGQQSGRRVMDLVKNPALRRIFITSGLLSMGWDLFTFVVPIYGARIGLSASMIGVILGAFAAATFAVRLLMPVIARHLKEWQVLSMALGITSGVYLLFPLIEQVPLLIALSFVLGIGLGSAQPMVMALLHNTTPPGRIGEAVGVRTTVMNTSHTLLPLLFGAVGAALGMTPVFWSLALILGAGSWFATKKRSD
jgi:predicted MFS family arabinose efflux permease